MRVDKPTLQCDRCGHTTTDLSEMGRYQKLTHYHQGGSDEWDLCEECWSDFYVFINDSEVGDRR